MSLGGATLDAVNTVVQPLERAHQVQDDRLSVLYGVKAGTEINDIVNDFSKQQGIIDDLQGQSDLLGQAIVGGDGDLAKELNGLKDATNKNLQDAKDNQLGGKNTINVNISIGSQKLNLKALQLLPREAMSKQAVMSILLQQKKTSISKAAM